MGTVSLWSPEQHGGEDLSPPPWAAARHRVAGRDLHKDEYRPQLPSPPSRAGLDLGREKQVSLTQIPQAWARGVGAGSMTQIFRVCEAQTRGGKRSPTCGAVTAQEEAMACPYCRDRNRCPLQQGEFWPHVGKSFQMLSVELGSCWKES